jgi:hypothetical protein
MGNDPDAIPEQVTGGWEMAAPRNKKKVNIA